MSEDLVIGVVFTATAVLISAVPVGLLAWERVRDNARVEWRFPRLLADARAWARSPLSAPAVPTSPRHRAHREASGLMRWLAARGRIREPAGYGPPPPLVPAPDPRSWAERDRKPPAGGYVNRAQGRVSVRPDPWAVLDATHAVLAGHVPAADGETTGLIVRVPAEGAPR